MIKLDRLINVLGGYGARLWCSSGARQSELGTVALHEPTEGATSQEDVLLGVGVEAGREAELLASTGSRVVVFRRSRLDESSVTVARERGIAVVLVDPAVSWGQLAGVVYGLVLEGRETESGRGPTDLFALADSLAATVGGPVTIEDRHSGVLAYSRRQETADTARTATILGRRVPQQIRRVLADRGVFARLASSEEPLFVQPSSEIHGRAVIAVWAGREMLGSIWVETDRPLDESGERALTEAAHTAALHMLRARASADLERQVESDLVMSLLDGSAVAPGVLSRLGLRGDKFRVVALQAGCDAADDAAMLLVFERATTGFGWTRAGRSAVFANTVYTIVPGSIEAARNWVDQLVSDMPADVPVLAGIGGQADSSQFVTSRAEADESLAAHDGQSGTVVVYEEAWHEIVLRRLRHAASAGRVPARGPVADLRRHDAEHGTRHVATLQAWLECQGDLGTTASRLGVHPNTVRYRLRRMSEVTRLDLANPERRLAMIIALLVA